MLLSYEKATKEFQRKSIRFFIVNPDGIPPPSHSHFPTGKRAVLRRKTEQRDGKPVPYVARCNVRQRANALRPCGCVVKTHNSCVFLSENARVVRWDFATIHTRKSECFFLKVFAPLFSKSGRISM